METLTKDDNNADKRNNADNAKPDKAARPGKLDLIFPADDGDIIFRSASIKPNNFRPRYVCAKSGEGRGIRREGEKERKLKEDINAFRVLLTSFYFAILKGCNPARAYVHQHSSLPLPLFYLPDRIVADTSDFVDDALIVFDVPAADITPLKTYTFTIKYRLGDDWDSGNIVPIWVSFLDLIEVLNVVVR